MTASVPRVASSLDDLRTGQVVAAYVIKHECWHLGQVIWVAPRSNTVAISLDSTSEEPEFQFDTVTWVILSDPPAAPVTVSREAFDRLARIVGRDEPMQANAQTATVDAMWHDEFTDAARALVDEVRQGEA